MQLRACLLIARPLSNTLARSSVHRHYRIDIAPTPSRPRKFANSLSMFRTALLRSARSAARAAPRCQAAMARPVARSSFFQPKMSPSTQFQAVRCYAASAGLAKEEVTGRIMDLLKNFDKAWEMLHGHGASLTLAQVQDTSKVLRMLSHCLYLR